MNLDAYLTENGLTPAQFAALIGDASESAVRKWRYGERIPRPDEMRRIADATSGAVTANDFYGIERAVTRRASVDAEPDAA